MNSSTDFSDLANWKSGTSGFNAVKYRSAVSRTSEKLKRLIGWPMKMIFLPGTSCLGTWRIFWTVFLHLGFRLIGLKTYENVIFLVTHIMWVILNSSYPVDFGNQLFWSWRCLNMSRGSSTKWQFYSWNQIKIQSMVRCWWPKNVNNIFYRQYPSLHRWCWRMKTKCIDDNVGVVVSHSRETHWWPIQDVSDQLKHWTLSPTSVQTDPLGENKFWIQISIDLLERLFSPLMNFLTCKNFETFSEDIKSKASREYRLRRVFIFSLTPDFLWHFGDKK